MTSNTIHEGRNIKRFREMMGMKQDALAAALGDDWNQQRVSLLEQKEHVEANLLQQVSIVLKIPVEAFQNFDEEKALNIISNNFHDFHDNASAMNNQCSFNPIDKIVALYDDKIALYERMLRERDEMMERLENLIGRK